MMSGGEMQLNLVAGSEPGQATSNSDDVQDVVASSSRLMRNGLEAMMHKIRQEFEIIPDDVLREFVSARVEEVVLSTVENYLTGWTRMMEKKIDVMVTYKVHQAISPIIEDLLPNIVKEAISSAVEKFRKDEGEVIGSTERNLELKFLVEVSAQVLTGKEIRGKEGATIGVALVDTNTGEVVVDGSEASAKVEISLVLNPENEGLNNIIIPESDKPKPHFTKNVYVYLKEGGGFLCDVKLGHEARLTKSCSCRLLARIVDNFSDIKVKDALTEPFEVKDSRSKSYEKHYPPVLSDKVWRLGDIHRGGEPCKRLGREKVETVGDFLFLHRIDPQGLKEIVGRPDDKWKAIVDHAKTCSILDSNKIYVYCCPSSLEGVTFDVVGELKGMICDSHFIPTNNLSDDEKARAQELLRLAFKNREDIEYFDDEAALLHKFPCKASVTTDGAVVNRTSPSTEIEGISSQRFSPPTGQLSEMSFGDPTGALSGTSSDPDVFVDYETLFADICYEETSRHGSKIYIAASVMLFRSRARKKVMALGNVCDINKRQRIGCV